MLWKDIFPPHNTNSLGFRQTHPFSQTAHLEFLRKHQLIVTTKHNSVKMEKKGVRKLLGSVNLLGRRMFQLNSTQIAFFVGIAWILQVFIRHSCFYYPDKCGDHFFLTSKTKSGKVIWGLIGELAIPFFVCILRYMFFFCFLFFNC